MSDKGLPVLPNVLLDAILENRAILFLGAGASLESKNSHGDTMPNADQLKYLIAEKYHISKPENRDLARVVEYAIKNVAGESAVYNEIVRLVSGFKPSIAHLYIPKYKWRMLATTNYDTLIEDGYHNSAESLQKCLPFVKDSQEYENERQKNPNSVPLLKLHGCVRHVIDRDIPLVLSDESYSRFNTFRTKLYTRLFDLASESVLIFIGYSFGDLHIQNLIHKIDQPPRPIWYMVAPDLDEQDAEYYGRNKINPIAAKFTDFTRALENQIEPSKRKLSYFSISDNDLPLKKFLNTNESPSEDFKFILNNDVQFVHSDISSSRIEPKNFYSGYDDGWWGIKNEYDFGRRAGEKLLATVLDSTIKKSYGFYLLQGPAGTGKSIALKRMAYDAATSYDQLVIWQNENSSPNFDFFRKLYEFTGMQILLFVDQISLHVRSIKSLMDKVSEEKIPLKLIGSDGEADWTTYCSELEELFSPDIRNLGNLSSNEANDLVELLEINNCLGKLEDYSKQQRIDLFMDKDKSNRQLLVALHELTSGKPFEDIILEEYNKILNKRAKGLYLDIATMHQFGVPAHSGTIKRISGIGFSEFKKHFLVPLSDKVIYNDKYTSDIKYQTRHSQVAKIVFNTVLKSDHEKSKQLCKIIDELDPGGYSSDARIIEELCRGHSVEETFSDVEAGRSIFRSAINTMPNSYFLFQQFSIFEYSHDEGSLKKAKDYADQALELSKIKIFVVTQLQKFYGDLQKDHLIQKENNYLEINLESN